MAAQGCGNSIEDIWRQTEIPVIYRPPDRGKVLLKLPYTKRPYSRSHQEWIRAGNQRKPEWLPRYKCWKVPRTWFNRLVESTLKGYKRLYIIQPYREQEVCAAACWNAKGHECQCSCMGANHGGGYPGGNWFEVSETFATRWREQHLACRLLQVNHRPADSTAR